ncbi:hypothetical protein EMIHUDRAFT_206048 [Emiliania huxleyi CCMP1516]|uniref:Hint domain-containing protein n=2 Tax=Emiliania huxleyi TaxID=2903 RepID=A0A0D3JQS1_EMIH1|nr:hypothetical protein EMIHUDRAFT_206048 [Emiliania huxleyi CCMP1516]EOD25856.1 hypothetical protein EMIHUDRAFT_206048 [Emiliania huxleyi CCMP1516]|eukprot:XP_005778285.1 hypothetical protein EMIHUDRAFT_206048 [Emiliania huxleyi CCMP1516]
MQAEGRGHKGNTGTATKPSVEGAGFDRQPKASARSQEIPVVGGAESMYRDAIRHAYKGGHNFGLSQATTECYTDIADESAVRRCVAAPRYMVDFNESEGESAFLVEGAQVQTELGPTASVKAGITSLPPSLLGAEACGVNNDVVVKEEAATQEAVSEEAVVAEKAATEEATIKSAAGEVSAAVEAVAEEAPVAKEVVAEEAAKEVEKPAKTVSNTPDPADTTCHPGLPTPKEVGKSGPASARSGSGPGYVDGVEAEVRRLGESVVYQATPADGKKSPSPGVPTSFGVAPKPLGAVAGAGQADAASREYYLAVRDKAMAAILLTKMQRAKLDAERSGCGCKCRRKAMRCRNNPTFGKGRRKSGKAGGRRKSGKAKGRGRGSHRRPKPRGGPQTPPCKSPDRRREPQTTSGKAPFAAGTCGAGAGTCGAVAGTCGAGGRAGLKAAADCVRGGYTKAEGAFRWLLLVCIPAFGHCAPAVPSPTEVASAFSSAVASSASSTFSSGVASAASSAFSPAVASKASSLVSCSPLLVPALVLILLAIACGASWPTAASGKGARGAVWATCLAAATACLTSAAAAPAGFFASAFSWLAAGPPKVAAAVAAGTAMWRRNSKARRFGWSSLLSVLLCLATVAGSLVTVTIGAALVASSTALPDVIALPASPDCFSINASTTKCDASFDILPEDPSTDPPTPQKWRFCGGSPCDGLETSQYTDDTLPDGFYPDFWPPLADAGSWTSNVQNLAPGGCHRKVPPGTVRVELRFFAFDSWDRKEEVQIYLNGELALSFQPLPEVGNPAPSRISTDCGNGYDDWMELPLVAQASLSGDDGQWLRLRISTTLDQPANDESGTIAGYTSRFDRHNDGKCCDYASNNDTVCGFEVRGATCTHYSGTVHGPAVLPKLCDGTLGFDVVSSFSLADPSAKAAFLSLATATATVTLTSTHKLPAGPAKALKQASEVAVGETVWLASPAAGTLAPVLKITKVVADGLHSPLTMHGGWPIVDGVATSYNSAAVVARNKYLVPLVEAACPSLGRLVVAAVNPKPMHYIDGEVVEPIASLEVAAAVAVTVAATLGVITARK